ncbi:hypothetical protein N7541_003563 [Penicillium brevicompactum]|uniref:Uncharacterized protein n=1 Tax=Penicillium brevicompactum TaxID=5074 RepID=A0A9W9RPL9_PENBR|nr:hypothetical protein N7541_003563 [Penicillium brevicompactum]
MSSIEDQLLRGSENYEEWHQAIHSAFQHFGVWEIVTGSEQPLLALDPPVEQAYKNWQRLDKSLSALLGITVDRAILVQMPENVSVDAMYEFLRTNYQPDPGPQFPELLKTLSRLRLENFASVDDYGHMFVTTQNEMETLCPGRISNVMVNTLFLDGLGKGWEEFRETMMEEASGTTLISLIADARDFVKLFIKEDEAPAQPTNTRRGRPYCGHCNMIGHVQKGCWRLEGRSEEEIKVIRRTLQEDRRKKQQKNGGPLARRVTRPPRTRGAPNRIAKF